MKNERRVQKAPLMGKKKFTSQQMNEQVSDFLSSRL